MTSSRAGQSAFKKADSQQVQPVADVSPACPGIDSSVIAAVSVGGETTLRASPVLSQVEMSVVTC